MPDSFLSRFLSGVLSVGIGSLSVMAMGLLGVMVIARSLPAEVYGIFVLLQVISAFLARISSFGLNLSVAKFVSSTADTEQCRQLINTALCFRLVTFPLIGIAVLLAKPVLSMLFNMSTANDIYVFVLLLFFLSSLEQLLKGVLQGLFLFREIAKFDLLASFLGFILLLVFVLLLDQGLMGLVGAKVLAGTIALVFGYCWLPIRKKVEFNLELLKTMLRFGVPLQLNDVLTFFFLRIDTLLIGALLGPAQIAYYEIARKIPESLSGLYEAFRTVFFPSVASLLAQGEKTQAAAVMNHSTRLLSFVTVLGALIALLFDREIISLLFSEEYLASVGPFVLLMGGLALAFTDYTLGYTLVAAGDPDKPIYINIVHTAVSVLGNLILIPMLGILGAALASIAGFAATNPLNLLFLRRRKIDVKVRGYLVPILIFGGCWLLITFLEWEGVLIKLFVLVLFVLISLFSSVVTGDDLHAVSHEIKTLAFRLLRKASSQRSHP